MKIKYLPFSGKTVWQNNKPFILFLLSLLLIHSILKLIFYNYNYTVLFTGAELNDSGFSKVKLIKWSLANDGLIILLINTALLLLLQMGRFVTPKITTWLTLPVFILINSFAVLLNLADIFYFRFHFQRANADLLYVLDHPFTQLFHQNVFIIAAFFAAIAGTIFLIWKLHKKLLISFSNRRHCNLVTVVLLLCIGSAISFKTSFSRILVPTYPLIDIKSNQLPVVQNSFHTFSYSVFRKSERITEANYLPAAVCDSIFKIKKLLQTNTKDTVKKNIVLFIMESVPYDFFDSASNFKVDMPFFDSILQHSTFFNNAFCYAHESNKGIVAILAGIPTLSEIPLYHSQFVNMPITRIGTALQKNNYNSFFCIGDDYDNFGFAKCMNWLGIEKYYSKEDIPDYKNKPMHSMGLQDEYVLDFMHGKINEATTPFFAINYNVSTHYPYDLPASFTAKFPHSYTEPMKTMRYYDHSLQQFFSAAKKESWFGNTIFIFCSDHWMFPEGIKGEYNALSGFKIPVIIYDPSLNEKKINNQLVSQFDIMGTILAATGYKDSIISYGGNLLDSNSIKGFVFSKPNSSLYQVADSNYILGFNIINNKVEYLYNYKKDKLLKENLLPDKNSSVTLNQLTTQVKAFIQKASLHYNSRLVK
ncbi:MAG: sulfatase-like hydrolase/transferase [Ferruginibacter sp.]